MILDRYPVFQLDTVSTSYLLRIGKFGHPEGVYYGAKIDPGSVDSLLTKQAIQTGSAVLYNAEVDPAYSLDTVRLEWSGVGCGDYRQTPVEIKLGDGSFRTDFVYDSHRILPGCLPMQTLPSAYADPAAADTLEITLKDEIANLTLLLIYTVFSETDVITRRAVLLNSGTEQVVIRRLMSLQLDLENNGYSLVTLDGAWIKETHRHDRKLQYGQFVNSSTTGASSNRHNPAFSLYEHGANETYGNVYGFNLVYSGNHLGLAELSPTDLVRVQIGINPHCFEWPLAAGESFETPEAVMTFSDRGFNGMSAHFHDFVNNHIVRGESQNAERPVLINNWEACFFKFTRGKLLRLARQAKRLGVELFVLDDGWFGKRDNDKAGLGDYSVNKKKLPWGMRSFAGEIHRLGLKFGLWFEPEMVNPDSDLFRAHSEYAVQTPNRRALMGRNQLVLDLCNPEVRDYIVDNVSRILDDAGIDYVKWDMNRHISDAYSPLLSCQGEFYHRYIMGLYDILSRIFLPRPKILLESCSSGGNRFDLGMLCFSPQVWSSDDTDPIERLEIQKGLSYFYPLSTMGAHVSASPNQQTLRETALSTRFNVASFGCLGYELDLKHLTRLERKEVRDQIAFYKAHRRVLQYGRMLRHEAVKGNKVYWQCVGENAEESVAGLFQTQVTAAEGNDVLPLSALNPAAEYCVETKPQRIFVRRFGSLLKHILPFDINPNGPLLRWIDRLYSMTDCVETYQASGDILMKGVHLTNQFIGTGYQKDIRMIGDYGSSLYVVLKV